MGTWTVPAQSRAMLHGPYELTGGHKCLLLALSFGHLLLRAGESDLRHALDDDAGLRGAA